MTDAIKCRGCGDPIEEWWNFCAMCGYHIAGNAAPELCVGTIKTQKTARPFGAERVVSEDQQWLRTSKRKIR